MADDELVYSQKIAGHIKSWHIPPALIVLNGCHNEKQVKHFHQAGVSVVIATNKAVNDGLAANFAQAFYASLLTHPRKTTLRQAFTQANSNALMGENRVARSLDLEDDNAEWDWDIFTQNENQENWVLHDLLTTARPVLSNSGELYNPYKGLEAFQEEDQSWFFGREHLSKDLSEMLVGANKPPRFLSLLGASGSGKSSIVNAGVFPRLREHDAKYLILQTRPGADPFAEMAELISSKLYPDSISQKTAEKQALTKQLEQNKSVLPGLIQSLLLPGGLNYSHVFLFIDQFEELFTHTRDVETQHYLEQLVALIESDIACTLVVIMRADFLAAALTYPQFAPHIKIPPPELLLLMSEADLRTAIERPAQRQHVQLENGLTETLLNDVGKRAGSLPLLQYVLSLLWEEREKRQDNVIRLEDYKAFGGLERALEKRATSLYQSFDEVQKQLCKGIFLRLVQPREGTEGTRRRAGLHEFSSDDEKEVIKQLTDARLLTTQGEAYVNGTKSDDASGSAAYAEVSHEALIRTWSQLKVWIADNRDEMRIQHQVSNGAKDWEEHGRSKDWLLTGTRLNLAGEWLESNFVRANDKEKAFIQSSNAQLNKKRLLTYALGICLFVALIIVAFVINTQKQEANIALKKANYNLAKMFEEKSKSTFDKAQSSNDSLLYKKAILFGLEAEQLELPKGSVGLSQSSYGLLSSVHESNVLTEYKQSPYLKIGPVYALAYSPDGTVIATASKDHTVRLWNGDTGELYKTLEGHTKPVYTIAYSPDGSVLASGSQDRTILLSDVKTGKTLKKLQGHSRWIQALAYSPDGKILASGSDDKTIKLWDTKTGELLKTLKGHSDYVRALAYSPDGAFIASGSRDNKIRLWDSESGQPRKVINAHSSSIQALAYSPDGNTLASGANDKIIKFWNAKTGGFLKKLEGHTDDVKALSYNSDGSIIASASSDKTIRLWNTKTALTLHILKGHKEPIYTVAFAPKRLIIASGSSDKTVRIWDAKEGRVLNKPQGHSDLVQALAYNPDGTVLASGSSDHRIIFWDTKTGQYSKEVHGPSGPVQAIAYSPDGSVIVSASSDKYGDKNITLWDTKTGSKLRDLEGHSGWVKSLAYHPNGLVFASGSDDKTIRLWDTKSGQTLKILKGHEEKVEALAYNPEGSVLVSGSDDKTIRQWSANSGKALSILRGHSKPVTTITYSPDGTTIASGSKDHTVRLWDAKTGRMLKTLIGHEDFVRAVVYSPDGKVIASASSDKSIRLWDAQTGLLLRILTGHSNYVKALAYNPEGTVIASGSSDNTIRWWDAKTGQTNTHHNLVGHSGWVQALSYNPHKETIASASDDHTIKLWNTKTGGILKTLRGHKGYIRALVNNSAGPVIISGSEDKTIRLWDINSGENLSTFPVDSPVAALALSPDGTVIASGSEDTIVRLWNVKAGKTTQLLHGHTDDIKALAYSPDGKILASGSSDYTIRLWDTATGTTTKRLLGHSNQVQALAYSPDGTTIASGSDDKNVRLWNTKTGQTIRTLKGHTGWVQAIAYSPDGTTIASGSSDNTVRLWDASTGKPLKVLKGHTHYVKSLAFSSDGEVIFSGSSDYSIRVWRINHSTHQLLYNFDPSEVSAALKFLWQLKLVGLDFKPTNYTPSLFPLLEYQITWTNETRKYQSLLNMPKTNESKLDQLVRWLKDRKAYRTSLPGIPSN